MTAQSRPDELIRILRAEFVTKSGGVPGGGATCVTWTCGAIGWRGEAGTTPRTLIHENAFQLSSYGNARGLKAVDLQQLHWAGYLGADVAAGAYSAILGGEENIISPGSDYSTINGPYNSINDIGWSNHTIGQFNDVSGDTYDIICIGNSHYVETDADYIYLFGSGHDVVDNGDGFCGLVCWSLIEQNEIASSPTEYPYNSGSFGLFLDMEGEVWMTYMFGEASHAYSDGVYPNVTMWNMTHGYQTAVSNVRCCFVFGQQVKSARVAYDGFYDGRIVLNSGTNSSAWDQDGTGFPGGYNQDSWFSQNDMIYDWPSSWITSRFEFPIITKSTWTFEAYIVGTELNCTNVYFWKIEGVVKNSSGTTTIPWSSVTNLYRDVATKEWRVIPDNVNDRLVFQFRYSVGLDWAAINVPFSMFTVEVGLK